MQGAYCCSDVHGLTLGAEAAWKSSSLTTTPQRFVGLWTLGSSVISDQFVCYCPSDQIRLMLTFPDKVF